jgi:amino acid adenylation domain-containing protein
LNQCREEGRSLLVQVRSGPLGPRNQFVKFGKEEIEQSIPSRFEQQVEIYPDQIAIKSRQHELTYQTLNQEANRLARAILAQRGEGPEHVGVLMGSDAPAIAAILGILKAGKSFAPLDPSFPRERLAHVIEDSQAGLIVTSSQHESLARELSRGGCPVLNVAELDPGLSGEDLDLAISPDLFAQIHYTSGSSGWPKGVAQNHRGVLHSIMNYTNSFHVCPDDRITMLHSIGSSASEFDMFCALLNGATLCPWDFKQEGFTGLARWLVEEEITVLQWVPTPFRAFMSTLTEERFPNVRLLALVGEAPSSTDITLYKRHLVPGSLFVNQIGSTETFDFRLFFTGHESEIDTGPVPVGYALDGKEVVLLDENGENIGFNRVGEIAVRSPYLAHGYWRQPEETRLRFLPDPAGGRERTYLTGDLGLMRPDGCLEHHGRKDFQVKIRGYRVEVSEIELAVLEHPGVKETVVVGREDRTGDMRLIAYVVLERRMDNQASELRGFVSERLPDYMVPTAFVVLRTLPLTPTGKVDRLALPAPELAAAGPARLSGGTQTPVEEALVRIWGEVLAVANVGVHDSFFDLGGNSLRAAGVIARILDTFRVELPLTSIFERSTIAELAEDIEKVRADGAAPASPRVTPVPRTRQRARRASQKL